MKREVIDKYDGSEKIEEMTKEELQKRIKNTYVFPKTASEKFEVGKTESISTPWFTYKLVKD